MMVMMPFFSSRSFAILWLAVFGVVLDKFSHGLSVKFLSNLLRSLEVSPLRDIIGSLQIRKDGRQLFFIDSKSKSLHNQGKKAAKIVWTRNWRVKHKKIKVTRDVRRIKKKTKKVQRAINGLDLQEIASRQSDEWKKERRAKGQEVKHLQPNERVYISSLHHAHYSVTLLIGSFL